MSPVKINQIRIAPPEEPESAHPTHKRAIREQACLLHPLAPVAPEAERLVNIIVVYEDAMTHKWACETCEQMFAGDGPQSVRSTWWRLGELGEPAVLAGAVSKAIRAHVIVVAIRATEGFPLPFYVWAGSWLPHRSHGAGKLVALIATPPKPGFGMNRAAQYLGEMAQRARMRFQITERNLACELPGGSEAEPRKRLTPLRAPSRTPALLHRYASRRWRLAA